LVPSQCPLFPVGVGVGVGVVVGVGVAVGVGVGVTQWGLPVCTPLSQIEAGVGAAVGVRVGVGVGVAVGVAVGVGVGVGVGVAQWGLPVCTPLSQIGSGDGVGFRSGAAQAGPPASSTTMLEIRSATSVTRDLRARLPMRGAFVT
jgi:hypothetical protein